MTCWFKGLYPSVICALHFFYLEHARNIRLVRQHSGARKLGPKLPHLPASSIEFLPIGGAQQRHSSPTVAIAQQQWQVDHVRGAEGAAGRLVGEQKPPG